MIGFGFNNIQLGSLQEKNLDQYRVWRNDKRIYRWCRQDDLVPEKAHTSWYHSLNDKTKMYEVIKDNTLHGVCGLTDINKTHNHAEFSLYLGPSSQGLGLSLPALQTLFSHGFLNLGLNVIWGETFDGNRAAKVFDKLGMVVEGKRREFYYKDGRYWDCTMYSMTRKDFEETAWGKKLYTSLVG